MPFPDINDNGKIDADDVYIYEEILTDEKKDKKGQEPAGCCVIFMAILLPSLLVAYKIFL